MASYQLVGAFAILERNGRYYVLNNIEFSTKSMVDDFGRVCFINNKVYRAIHPKSEKHCLQLLNSKLFIELMTRRLVPSTKISDQRIPGFSLVLEHEKLVETLEHEWSFNMFLDGAKMVLEVNRICNKYGYELKDAHSFNVLFRNAEPVFVDIGSIQLKSNNATTWSALLEFTNTFYIPLLFWQDRKYYIVRKLLESNFYRMQTFPMQSLMDSGLLELLTKTPYLNVLKVRGRIISRSYRRYSTLSFFARGTNFAFSKLTNKPISVFSYEPQLQDLAEIESTINNMHKPDDTSEWRGYHTKFYQGGFPSNRFKRIIEIIKGIEHEINSTIDIAGNEGLLSSLIQQHTKIEKILLTDNDENAIDHAYCKLKGDSENRISPILLNFIFTPDIKGTALRLKSDLAIALAVTHHLTLRFNISIGTIMDRISALSNKYVIIEFMPLGLYSSEHDIIPEIPDWYNIEWFRSEFKKHFEVIIEEKIEKNRVVFFGKKIF